MYVYQKFETGVWTVGFYKPDGEWVPEGDYLSDRAAANRVHYLNGGTALPPVRYLDAGGA